MEAEIKKMNEHLKIDAERLGRMMDRFAESAFQGWEFDEDYFLSELHDNSLIELEEIDTKNYKILAQEVSDIFHEYYSSWEPIRKMEEKEEDERTYKYACI